jgi:hypothetical protein
MLVAPGALAPRPAVLLRTLRQPRRRSGGCRLRPGGEVLLDGIKDRQPLVDQASRDLTEPIRPVQHVDVRPGQAGRRFPDDLRELVDERPVQGYPVVRGRRLRSSTDRVRPATRQSALTGSGRGLASQH